MKNIEDTHVRITEAMNELSLGRAEILRQIESGGLEGIQVGKSVFVSIDSVQSMLWERAKAFENRAKAFEEKAD